MQEFLCYYLALNQAESCECICALWTLERRSLLLGNNSLTGTLSPQFSAWTALTYEAATLVFSCASARLVGGKLWAVVTREQSQHDGLDA
jgi:hypothetical protein